MIFLYGILDSIPEQQSISIEQIQKEVGDKFLCNRAGTEEKLKELEQSGFLVYKQDAGRKEIQLKKGSHSRMILNQYYGTV